MLWSHHSSSRRQFLSGLAAFVGVVGFDHADGHSGSTQQYGANLSAARSTPTKNLARFWQFSADGPPEQIRSVLAAHNMSMALKTHDGTRWMSRFDTSHEAVTGPHRVEQLARYFEEGGVPFHAWCVLNGKEPEREAWMCAEVLAAGARSMIIDLEPYAGFWRGSSIEAKIFGTELRRLQPDAWISVSVDARPWQIGGIPLSEFAAFSNELAPQVYWQDFTTRLNIEEYIRSGLPPGPDGVTPQFALDTTFEVLDPYNLPIQPVGQGSVSHDLSWQNFVAQAFSRGASSVSVWRFGVTAPNVWSILKDAARNTALVNEPVSEPSEPS
jgi:hypothetical protein